MKSYLFIYENLIFLSDLNQVHTELVYLILQKLFTAISMHAVAIHTLFSWPKTKKR